MFQIQAMHKPTGEVVFFSAETRSAIQRGLSYLGEPLTVLKIRRISKRRMKRKIEIAVSDDFKIEITRDPETGNWRWDAEYLNELSWWCYKHLQRNNFIGHFCGFYK